VKQVRLFVSGRVQGVFFRVYTRNFCHKLQAITGYVKNLRDGRVEILAEGSEFSLKKLVDWVRKGGSPASHVTKAVEEWKDIDKREFSDFSIAY